MNTMFRKYDFKNNLETNIGPLPIHTVVLYVHSYPPHSLSLISPEQATLNHNLAHN